jgi:hypothetical protein
MNKGGNMFRALRAFVLAVTIAASLLGSASVASADTTAHRGLIKPPPARLLDITWE